MNSSSPEKGHRRGVVMVLAAAALWSTSGLLVRIIQADEPTMIFWRSISAATFLSVYILRTRGHSVRSIMRALGWPGLFVSVLLSLDAIISLFALSLSHVANVMLIFSITPFVAALIAWLWLREKVRRETWLAIGLCVTGVAIMVSASLGSHVLLGDFLAFIVVALFATAVVAIRRFPNIDLVVAVWLSCLLGAVLSYPFATPLGHGAVDYTLMGIFGAFEYALALLLFTAGARSIPAAQSTLIGLLEVVLSPIWVWLAVNEVPPAPTITGGTVILLTLIGYTLRDLIRRGGSADRAVVR